MLLGMSAYRTHAASPAIVQTKASDMRSGSIRSTRGKWKPESDPVYSGDGLLIVQINPRRCAGIDAVLEIIFWMRGGNGGSRSFLSEVGLSFVSMIP